MNKRRKDGKISDQKKDDEETDSDFKFLSENVFETDSDSEPDFFFDNNKINVEEGFFNTV